MPNLAPQIDIEINPVYFIFSWKVHKRKVATLVSFDGNTRELVAIGERAAGDDVVSVALFAPEESLPAGVDRMELLQTFLEFNIAKLLEKQKLPVFKPRVVYHDDQQLGQVLCGFQRGLLKTAAVAAGAKEVVFE